MFLVPQSASFLLCILILFQLVNSQPNLDFETRLIDLDTMVQGESKEVKVPFRNAGDSLLIIERTKSSCGCTAAFSTKKRIPPDSGGDLTIKFSSMQFRGHKKKKVYVYSNDPDRPVDTLTIETFVKSEIDCTPRNIFIKKIHRGKVHKELIRLYNPGTIPITVEELAPDKSFITVRTRFPQTLQPGDTLPAIIHVKVDEDSRRVNGKISVKISGGAHPYPFMIRVFGIYKD